MQNWVQEIKSTIKQIFQIVEFLDQKPRFLTVCSKDFLAGLENMAKRKGKIVLK